ncbi:hypothetical protein ASD15_18205 [Massilia sp. Root351]|jgi:hypothetical protein|uniref:hypothetical protein n=1 Tax=Massilia sp. Root351 TaxID=1736522 RepID=UPI0007103843|nr:hypothetical protein [Massilia sp. Root351]KQV79933.1 hypothetical protein ASD15_18205 [Massilia sp. Root351]
MKLLLYIYLAAGIATAAAVLLHNLTSHQEQPRTGLETLTAQAKRRQVWIKVITAPILVALILLAWPLVLILLWDELRSRKNRETYTTRPFRIATRDLVRCFTVEQIEDLECVRDPLGAAPCVPFGHLYASWQQFTEQLLPDDVIWSFSTRRLCEFKQTIFEDGYVILRGGEIGPHYLTRSA